MNDGLLVICHASGCGKVFTCTVYGWSDSEGCYVQLFYFI